MKNTLLFLFMLVNQIDGKAQALTYFNIIPQNPTVQDSVVVTFGLTFPWYGAVKLSGSLTNMDDTIVYRGCYRHPLFAQAESYLDDTIRLGQLEVGAYELYVLRSYVYNSIDTGCMNVVFTDTLDTFFVVSPVNSVDRPVKNPLQVIATTTQLTLTMTPPTQATTATITDINGRLLRTERLLNASNTFSIAELPAGLYFITVQTAKQKWVRRFVKQ